MACHRTHEHADATAPISTRGEPFVLGQDHAIGDAIWLPNGNLLGASKNELYVLAPDTGNVRWLPLDKPGHGLFGSNGAKHVVVVEGEERDGQNLAVYDTSTFKVVNRFVHASVLGSQGDLAALAICESGSCKNHLVDLARPDPLFTFETPGVKTALPNIVDFSPDGRFVDVYGIGETHIVEVRTGKVLVKRKARRTSEGGWRQDMFALRNDRVLMSSVAGFEVIELPSGKATLTMPDPFAAEGMVDFKVDREGKHAQIYAPRLETLVVWSPEKKPPLGARLPLKADDWEPEDSLATAHFHHVEQPKCRIVETATKRVVFEHVAICGSNDVIHAKPGFRPDEKYFGVLYEGSLYALDLATSQLAGIGELPTPRPSSLDRLRVDDGFPKMSRTSGSALSLTRKPSPAAEPTPGIKTATHRFVCTQTKEERTLVAYDRTGKEVLRETLPVFDTTVQASDDIAFVRVTGGDYLRCQPGNGCKPAPMKGYVGSFDNPWVLLGRRHDDTEPERLFNLVTSETRPLPPTCGAFLSTVFRDGPRVLCSGGPNKPSQILNADGSLTRIALPDTAPRNTMLVGRAGSIMYFAGVVNAGLAPAYRYDLRTLQVDRIHMGAESAIVEFPDGKIERFGSDAALESLRCRDGEKLFPWSACSAAFEVEGRFDGAPDGYAKDASWPR